MPLSDGSYFYELRSVSTLSFVIVSYQGVLLSASVFWFCFVSFWPRCVRVCVEFHIPQLDRKSRIGCQRVRQSVVWTFARCQGAFSGNKKGYNLCTITPFCFAVLCRYLPTLANLVFIPQKCVPYLYNLTLSLSPPTHTQSVRKEKAKRPHSYEMFESWCHVHPADHLWVPCRVLGYMAMVIHLVMTFISVCRLLQYRVTSRAWYLLAFNCSSDTPCRNLSLIKTSPACITGTTDTDLEHKRVLTACQREEGCVWGVESHSNHKIWHKTKVNLQWKVNCLQASRH